MWCKKFQLLSLLNIQPNKKVQGVNGLKLQKKVIQLSVSLCYIYIMFLCGIVDVFLIEYLHKID